MNNKRAFVISFSPLDRDPRVSRQLAFLEKEGYEVTVAGMSPPKTPHKEFISSLYPYRIPLGRVKRALFLFTRQFESFYWHIPQVKYIYERLKNQTFDLYIANDLNTLPLTLKLANNKKVLFDAHEYAPREFEDRFFWKLLNKKYLHHLCDFYLHQSKEMVTVCRGIAEEYAKHFHVTPSVITNAPPFYDLKPRAVKKEHIRMIYHGVAAHSRRIDDVIEIMRYLDDRFFLDMILIPGDIDYIESIKIKAKKHPRIRFIPPVEMSQIPNLCNEYDIGFFPLRPTNFNYLNALPNKFFEFVQGRLAIAISPLKEMSRLVQEYNLGIIAPDFEPKSFARGLNALSAQQIEQFKQSAHQAAPKLCAEENEKILKNLIHKVTDS